MVEIEQVQTEPSVSESRLLDAEEIERAAATVTRPSAKIQLEALAKKLRKESAALKRVEESRTKMGETKSTNPEVEAPEPVPVPAPVVQAPPPAAPNAKYAAVDKFAFDDGGYSGPYVTLYVNLPSVGSIPKDQISCEFTSTSFDLVVKDLNGKSYRLFKDNLEKEISPDKSKYIVKSDKVIVKLAKIKSEYGSYDYWSQLTAKKKPKLGTDGKRQQENPASSIMDLMKDMYDSGDDNMRKVIGETMLKQRSGQLDKDGMLGKGGLDGMDDNF